MKRVFLHADKDLKKKKKEGGAGQSRSQDKDGSEEKKESCCLCASPALGRFHLDLVSNCCKIPRNRSVSAHSGSQNDQHQQ